MLRLLVNNLAAKSPSMLLGLPHTQMVIGLAQVQQCALHEGRPRGGRRRLTLAGWAADSFVQFIASIHAASEHVHAWSQYSTKSTMSLSPERWRMCSQICSSQRVIVIAWHDNQPSGHRPSDSLPSISQRHVHVQHSCSMSKLSRACYCKSSCWLQLACG